MTGLGAALRRAGWRSESREILRPALDLVHRCGALALTQPDLISTAVSGQKRLTSRRDSPCGRGVQYPPARPADGHGAAVMRADPAFLLCGAGGGAGETA